MHIGRQITICLPLVTNNTSSLTESAKNLKAMLRWMTCSSWRSRTLAEVLANVFRRSETSFLGSAFSLGLVREVAPLDQIFLRSVLLDDGCQLPQAQAQGSMVAVTYLRPKIQCRMDRSAFNSWAYAVSPCCLSERTLLHTFSSGFKLLLCREEDLVWKHPCLELESGRAIVSHALGVVGCSPASFGRVLPVSGALGHAKADCHQQSPETFEFLASAPQCWMNAKAFPKMSSSQGHGH